MHDPKEQNSLEENDAKVIEFSPETEDSSRYERSQLRRMIPPAVFVFAALACFAALALTVDSHRRNILIGGTATFLVFFFLFGALIIWSYKRDKKKLIKQDPYRDDHIVE